MAQIMACRMCLSVEGRMFVVADTSLQEIYEKLTNTALQSEDGRPMMACYICHRLLAKSRDFSERATRANKLLNQIFDWGLELTQKSLGMLHASHFTHQLCASTNHLATYDPLEAGVNALPVKTEVEDEVDEGKYVDEDGMEEDSKDDHKSDDDRISGSEEEYPRAGASGARAAARGLGGGTAVSKSNLNQSSNHDPSKLHPLPNGKVKSRRNAKDKVKPYKCTLCPQAFTRNSHLKRHMIIHTRAQPYPCELCDQGFNKKVSLTKHMRSHIEEKPVQCTVCNQTFSGSGNLNKHMRIHTGERPYICSLCYRAFNQSSSLNEHMRMHTGEKPYQCSECTQAFTRSSHLSVHMRIHTGEKPYQCTHCEQAFKQSSSLNKHMRIHTGEKPYECGYCKRTFTRNCHLNVHMRTHTGERPYKCTHCDQAFNQSTNLNRHMKVHQENEVSQP